MFHKSRTLSLASFRLTFNLHHTTSMDQCRYRYDTTRIVGAIQAALSIMNIDDRSMRQDKMRILNENFR